MAGAGTRRRAAGRPLFYGWVVVGGAFAILFAAYGAQYAFGVFFAALIDEFGWSRASLAGAFSLYTFVYCGCALVTGRLTDAWGPRAVIAAGGLFLGLGLTSMSGAREIWHPYVLYGVVAALGMSAAYVPCTATVARWFVRRRGLAIGAASAGMGLGTFALPPAAQFLVSHVGWRWAYAIFGVGILVSLNLVATVMRRDPESLGLRPDGESVHTGAAPSRGREAAWTVSEAVRTRSFWVLFALFGTTWVPIFVPLVHLVPMARGRGVSPLAAATLMSALGLAAVAGRFLMGAASDRVGRRPTLAVALALQVAAFIALAHASSLAAMYAAALLFGFSYGGVSVMFPSMVADFFGREHAGSIVGVLFATAGGLTAWGPTAAGWIYDRYGSYDPAWWLSAGFNALALGVLVFARPPAAAPDRRALLDPSRRVG